MQEAIVEKLSKIEGVTATFEGLIEKDAAYLRKECGVVSADEMRKQLAALEDEHRLLNIGIIGMVKAGKSSILNSIFFDGERVLPTGPTPKTAALSIMTYGDTASATVDYYTQKDIGDIKKGHAAYLAQREEMLAENQAKAEKESKNRGVPLNRNAVERTTDAKMKDNPNYAAYDHCERMIGPAPSNGSQLIGNLSSIPELMGKLDEYVGANGKMMPFTKSVEIRLPKDDLRDICVVDTPGLDDTVASRVERTEEYLSKCDVVFVVSQAQSFIKDTDLALMDRLSAINGVQREHVYLIGSKTDSELTGNEAEQVNFDLHKAYENICATLSSRAISQFKELVGKNPEAKEQFERLIESGMDRAIMTSAICHDMLRRYGDRASWDNGMNGVWDELVEYYPDYFDNDENAKANLEFLSGVGKVKDKIALARKNKEEILARNKDGKIETWTKNINDFSQKLVAAVKEKSDKVKNTDIADVEAQIKDAERLISKGTNAIDSAFEDCVDEFKLSVGKIVDKESKILIAAAKGDFKTAEDSRTETSISYRHELLWGLLKFGREVDTYQVRTLRTGAVKSTLKNLVIDLQEALRNSAEEAKVEWKAGIQKKITNALTEVVEGDYEALNFDELKKALRRIVAGMEIPNLDFGSNKFSSSFSGTIEDDDADRFMDEALSFLADLRNVFNSTKNDFLARVEKSMSLEKMSDMIFTELKDELVKLRDDIQNQALTLDRLDKCAKALEQIA